MPRSTKQQRLESILRENAPTLHALAQAGTSRRDIVEQLSCLLPASSMRSIDLELKRQGILFNSARSDSNFDDAVIGFSVWVVMARRSELEGDLNSALVEVPLDEMRHVSERLDGILGPERLSKLFRQVGEARQRALAGGLPSLPANKYDAERRAIIAEFGTQGKNPSVTWPPTSQTVKSRLGGGYWADAMRALGVQPGGWGRARGALIFNDEDYLGAMTQFLADCDRTGAAFTVDGYSSWLESEEIAGRRHPSFPSIRIYFGSWSGAKRAVLPEAGRNLSTLPRGIEVAALAMADAIATRTSILASVAQAEPKERSKVIAESIKSYMGTFEKRRREWFRAVLSKDPASGARRLAKPGLSKKIRERLQVNRAAPSLAVDDMYIDKLFGCPEGVLNHDGWFSQPCQDSLSLISADDVAKMDVLREMRNLFVHRSKDASDRLALRLAALGEIDSSFTFGGRGVTVRTVTDWLASDDLRRLKDLTNALPSVWAKKLEVEIAASSPQGS